jgi:hypothetical protein
MLYLSDHDKGEGQLPLTSERSTFLTSSHAETGAYPPKPAALSAGPSKGWLGRLLQTQTQGEGSYIPISNEELAPLHHRDGDGDGEYEVLERDGERR